MNESWDMKKITPLMAVITAFILVVQTVDKSVLKPTMVDWLETGS